MMREAFHAQLDALAEHSGSMCMVTGALLEQATRSACQTDQAAAHWVVAGAVELDRQRGHAEELVVRLLALQAPVATDLRRVVSALWIVGDVHRMGMLAIHVAQATLRRYPEPVLPVTIRPVFTRMGQIGEQLAGQAAAALRSRDVALAQAVSARNPEMDRLHRNYWPLRSTRPGRTGWPRRSTPVSSAGSTTGSPTTPPPSRTESSTRSPATPGMPTPHDPGRSERTRAPTAGTAPQRE